MLDSLVRRLGVRLLVPVVLGLVVLAWGGLGQADAVGGAGEVAAAADASGLSPDEVVAYRRVGEVSLSLHVFVPEGASDAPRPVMLWFHGGGWSEGSATQFYPQARHLAERGMVAISAEYRVRGRHGTTPYDAIRDAFAAMRFVRENAGRWGGDPERVGAGGGSAGGHLAACLATLTAEDLAGTAAEREAARPDVLLLLNPAYDNGPVGGVGHERFGDRWREGSPAHNLHEGMPATLVMLGDRDALIPVATAERFGERLERLGVEHRLILYPGAQHGFFNPGYGGGRFYRETVEAMDGFLAERGWLTATGSGHR